MRLAESLVNRGTVDLDDVAAKYLDWWHKGAFDTGPVAARVATLVHTGLSFQAAARQVHDETGGQTKLEHCRILPRVRSAAAILASRWGD